MVSSGPSSSVRTLYKQASQLSGIQPADGDYAELSLHPAHAQGAVTATTTKQSNQPKGLYTAAPVKQKQAEYDRVPPQHFNSEDASVVTAAQRSRVMPVKV